MARARKTEVLVAGAGPVGLFTALCLAERGIDATLVDEQWRAAAHSYALGLHASSLDLLDDLGLAESLIPMGRQVETVGVYVGGERAAEFDLTGLPARHSGLLVLPQSEFEGVLERALVARGAEVLWNHSLARLEAGAAYAAADVERLEKCSVGYAVATTEWIVAKTLPFEAGIVVGADGHASTVRNQLGIRYETCGDAETFAVFEFDTVPEAPPEVRLALDEAGVSVLWPLPGGRCRISFQVAEDPAVLEERDKCRVSVHIGKWAFPHLGREELLNLLEMRMPWFESEIGDLHWSLSARFERRLAESYGRARAWLAGDSAHLTGPAGIQSMNAGLLEGAALADAIEQVLRHGAGLEVLENYGAQARKEWERLLGVGGEAAVAADAPEWVREHASRLLPCLPAVGENLDALAARIGLTSRVGGPART